MTGALEVDVGGSRARTILSEDRAGRQDAATGGGDGGSRAVNWAIRRYAKNWSMAAKRRWRRRTIR